MNNNDEVKPFASENGRTNAAAQTADKNKKSGNKPVNGAFGGKNKENDLKNTAEDYAEKTADDNAAKTEDYAEKPALNHVEAEAVKTDKNKAGKTAETEKKESVFSGEQKGGELYAAKKAAEEFNAKKSDVEQKKFIKGLIISYGVCFLIAAGLCLWIAAAQGVFELTEPREIFAVLSDAFFVPGVLVAGFGLLYKIAAGGALDGVSFGLKRAFLSLIPGGRLKKEENYAQYKERKEKRRKNIKIAAPLIVGAVFIVVAAIFLILYSKN